MSVRSLLEFNHDHAHAIRKNPKAFTDALVQYLSSGDTSIVDGKLRPFGVCWYGTKHHSVEWRLAKGETDVTPQTPPQAHTRAKL